MRQPVLVSAPLLFTASCCFAAGAAGVSGSFSSTDSKYGAHPYAVPVVDGYAYRSKARFDETRQVTVVVLADKEIDAAALNNAPDLEISGSAEQLDGAKVNYVEWEVSDDSHSPTLNEHVVGEHGVNNLSGMFTATYKTKDGSRIEGTCSATTPPEKGDYPTDLTFSLAIAKP